MIRITQRIPNDCMICCLAMITDQTYEQVADYLHDWWNGNLNMADATRYFAEHGYASRVLRKMRLNLEPAKPWPPAPFAPRHLVMVRPSFSSLSSHGIAMNQAGVLFDPDPESTAKTLSDFYRVDSIAGVVWRPANIGDKHEHTRHTA